VCVCVFFQSNILFKNCGHVRVAFQKVEGGLGFIVQLGVALLAHLEKELLAQNFDTLLIWLKQRLKTMTAAELLASSRQLGRRMRHVKDYTTTPVATDGTAADMTSAMGEADQSGLASLGGRAFPGFAVGGGLGGGHGLAGLGDLGGTLLAGLQGDSREAWRRLRRPRWMPDEEVQKCHTVSCTRRFSALSQRKHHCRRFFQYEETHIIYVLSLCIHLYLSSNNFLFISSDYLFFDERSLNIYDIPVAVACSAGLVR
jgi:hypothetical protein